MSESGLALADKAPEVRTRGVAGTPRPRTLDLYQKSTEDTSDADKISVRVPRTWCVAGRRGAAEDSQPQK